MKNVTLPFGISSIAGTSFCAVKMTAKISKSHRTDLMREFENLNVVGIPRKDGGEPTTYKFTMVCTYNEAYKFYAELRLAIIDRKEAELTARRLRIINELEERGGITSYNDVDPKDMFTDDLHDALPW